MDIKISYDEEFTTFFNRMRKKYGEELFTLDGINGQLDINSFSKKLYSKSTVADNSVDGNANVSDFSPAVYMNELTKPFLRLNSYYILWKQLRLLYNNDIAEDILEKQLNGTIYINDMHLISAKQSYCYNFTALDIVKKGLPFIHKIKTVPPKYLYSFKSQLEQFIVFASNNISGATGIADLFVVMSWYIENALETMSDGGFKFKNKEDIWKYVEETISSFIYTINQPFRGGVQSPFVNVSIYDNLFLDEICKEYTFPNGKHPNKDIINKVQELYLKIMNKELNRTPVTFPVTTACFSLDKDNNIQDETFLKLIVEQNKQFGFINLYFGDTKIISACCRLKSKKDNPYFNSFGGISSAVGSVGVLTLNLVHMAFISKDKTKFMEAIKKNVEVAARVNHAKRVFIKKGILDGFLPLYKYGFINLNRQYSTVGLNGINEALEILGLDILKEDGQKFVEELLTLINEENEEYQEKYDSPHNCEQTPSENSAIKLAEKDRLLGLNTKYALYSNQFIPLTTNADLLDRIIIQGKFDSMFSGGAIVHLNIEQRIEDSTKMEELIKFTAKKGVIYAGINYTLQECEDGHMGVGKKDTCLICGKKIVNEFTRIVGFLTNVKNWNKVRREIEYPNRKWAKYEGYKPV